MKYLIKKISHEIWLYFLMLIGLLVLGSNISAQGNDSKGRDFWLMFNSTYQDPTTPTAQLTLFITSGVNTSGTVAIPGLAFSSPFTVTANAVTAVIIPSAASVHTSDGVDNTGIHVTSADEVTVYGLNYEPYITDAYLGLPTDVLGNDYIVLTYSNSNIVNGSEFGIVGTVNGTTLTITPSVTTGLHVAGVPYTITVNQGETYELVNTDGTGDLSGTIITSTNPVGVFGAHECANIPGGFSYCDHICEMLPPTTTWGKRFGTVPLKTRVNGDSWRFLASEDNTTVTVNGIAHAPINRGQFIEEILTGQSIIESDKPILTAQYSNSSTYSGEPGDPFMMLIPPLEQFLPGYTLTTVTGYEAHYINLVAPDAVVGSLTMDGVPVAAGEFTPIGTTGFSGAQLTVLDGSHTLAASLPFGAFQYGFNSDDSYGYPGGQSFSAIATVNTITLTPPTGTALTGTNTCFNALVKDQFNAPVEGVRVDFNIEGANPGSSGFAFTNAAGIAQFCYTGSNAGTDSLKASIGSLFAVADFIWTNDPAVASTITLTPPSGTAITGTNTCFEALVKDQFDAPLAGETVNFNIAGVNSSISGSGVTNASGIASFCYTGINAGTDNIIASDGSLNASAVFIWTNNSPSANTITITPLTGTGSTGTVTCFNALIKDQFDAPLAGITVDFSIAGANSTISGSAITDGSGNAEFCYIGANTGTDNITATAGLLSAAASFVWVNNTPVATNLSITPLTGTAVTGTSTCFDALVTDQFGIAMPGVPVDFNITGANAISAGAVTTNASGIAHLCYTGVTAGTDNINASTGALNAAATFIWTSNSTPVCHLHGHIKVVPDVAVANQAPHTIYLGYGPQEVKLKAIASGNGPYTYLWSTGETTQSIYVSPIASTTYTVTVTRRQCQVQLSVVICVVDVRCGCNKVKVCHHGHTICIPSGQVAGHLCHGDMLGNCGTSCSCDTTTTPVPPGTPSRYSESEDDINPQQGNNLTAVISPNPSAREFTLAVTGKAGSRFSYRLVNGAGHVEEIKKELTANQAVKLGASLRPGIYYIEISSGTERKTLKLVKL